MGSLAVEASVLVSYLGGALLYQHPECAQSLKAWTISSWAVLPTRCDSCCPSGFLCGGPRVPSVSLLAVSARRDGEEGSGRARADPPPPPFVVSGSFMVDTRFPTKQREASTFYLQPTVLHSHGQAGLGVGEPWDAARVTLRPLPAHLLQRHPGLRASGQLLHVHAALLPPRKLLGQAQPAQLLLSHPCWSMNCD